MKSPAWYSEPFPPGGALAARGILNQLGRPNLSLFEILAREAIQNSWDARAGRAAVDFRVAGWTCTADQQTAIRRLLGTGAPTQGLALKASLAKKYLRLLIVSDSGTTGLGGPTRADVEQGDESQDFVAFVRNVGERRDKEFGAGTFGFGKSIFFLVSQARTVMVYTRCKFGRGYQSRFIGCAIGDDYRVRDGTKYRPYTGRHWWGIAQKGVQEPLLGAEADKVANVFGLEPFAGSETGTAIVVIDPAIEEPADDMRAISWAITWHAWPKMIAARASMRFSVAWEGEEIPVPDPVKTPPLDAFVAAFRRLDSGEAIECPKPAKLLGRLALERQLVRVLRPTYPVSFDPPISSPVHHVALVRAPQFVVRYFPGDPLAGDVAEYAGVFMVDSGVDDAFANAEPPTHDDWIPTQLLGHEKRYVRTLFANLRDRLRTFARPTTPDAGSGGGIPLGAASADFASLVASAHSTGGTNSGVSPAKGGKGRTDEGGSTNNGRPNVDKERVKQKISSIGSIEELGEPHYGDFDRRRVLLFPFRVSRALDGTLVAARLAIGVDENHQSETEPPDSSLAPQVVGWLGASGEVVRSNQLPTQGRVGQVWEVAVLPVPDTVTVSRLILEKSGT